MAGSYPDVPGRKVHYDRDGSTGFRTSGDKTGTITTASVAQLQALNDEDPSSLWSAGAGNATNTFGILFPNLMDIVGVLADLPSQISTEWETSADTTNGLDGTWTSRFTSATVAQAAGATGPAAYRSQVVAAGNGLPWTGIKAVRLTRSWGGDATWRGFHLYGAPSAGAAPDRLRLWHATLDEELAAAALDFGDVARASAALDKLFRVKNASAALTANSVTVSTEALTDASPTVLSTLTIGLAGSFAASQAIGSLAAGALSGVLTLRLAPSATAQLGVWRQRLRAVPSSWT